MLLPEVPLRGVVIGVWCVVRAVKMYMQYVGLKFFYTLSFQKGSIAFYLSLLVSQFPVHMLTFCLLLCSLALILVSLIYLHFFFKFLWHKICFVSNVYSFLQVYLVIVTTWILKFISK